MNLNGTGVAIITPFKSDDSIDFDALTSLIHFLIDGGIDYIVTLGTTGETPVLNRTEKQDIILHTYRVVNGRVPVVVGVGGNCTRSVLDEMKALPLSEASAILSASPYYNKPSQEGIFRHYQLLAEHAPQPIILYNVPGRTGRNMSASTVLRIANASKNVIGIKEASGDMAQCMQILKDKPAHFSVISGDDALALPQIACGMCGVISVAANAFPRHFGGMVKAALQHDFLAAKKLNDSLMPAYDLMFEENNPAGIKAFLSLSGMIDNQLRLPLVPVSDALLDRTKQYLNTIKMS